MYYSQSSLFGTCFKGPLDQAKQLDPDNILKTLVYAAAEAGAMRFIQTIFSLPAGRIAFEAYREDSSLPEDIAEENGHGKVAAYLRDITRRLVDDLCTIQSLIASVFLAWINIDRLLSVCRTIYVMKMQKRTFLNTQLIVSFKY